MKYGLFVLFTFLFVQLNAQTSLIAHKSHSGNATTYFIDPSANFGIKQEPPYFEYELVNDTVVVRVLKNNGMSIKTDTLKKNIHESINKFERKDRRKMEDQKVKANHGVRKANAQFRRETRKKINKQKEVIPVLTIPKRNPPSFLFIFFAVSIVGLVVLRLLNRIKLFQTE